MTCSLCGIAGGLEGQQALYAYGKYFLCERDLRREDSEWLGKLQEAAQELRAWKSRQKLQERSTKDMGSSIILGYKDPRHRKE